MVNPSYDTSRQAFEVRRCQAADAASLAALAVGLFRQAYSRTHPEAQLAAYLAREFAPHRVALEMAEAGTCIWVAQGANGELIGYIWLRDAAASLTARVPGSHPLQLRRIFVDPAWHGRGVAQRLIEECLAEARRRAADAIWLAVWERAERPIAFYRKEGFEVVGTASFPIEEHVDHDFIMARPMHDGDRSSRSTS